MSKIKETRINTNKINFTIYILLFAKLLISQEQVSEIKTFAVDKVTNIDRKIGFAQLDNEDYMLMEKDSLIILKWNGTAFESYSKIKAYNLKYPIGVRLDPNRSR